ncbi:MAG: M81 family metallopeptidase [Acidobacteriales bacterium]|nr:M81 family metallopeptidase [Terriglobales bacterium]
MDTSKPRVAIAGILHESNSFFRRPTRLTDFDISRGDQVPAAYAAGASEIAGFLDGARKFGFEVVPVLVAWATPGGPVETQAFEALTTELIGTLKAQPHLDGLLLALHGAMVSDEFPHADAEIARRVREAVGPGFPVVVTHDFHGNVAPDMIRYTDVLLSYKTNPHIDQHECGTKAARILHQILTGRARPVQAIAKPALLYNIRFQNTNLEPLRSIVDESRMLERDPRVLTVSVLGGYQYADTPAMGASVVVVTDNEPDLARAEADRLGRMLWDTRDRLRLDLPDAAAAVRQACASS